MVTDGIVKIHVHNYNFFISFHRGWTRILRWTRVSSHYNWLPLRFRCPNWMWPYTCCFLPQLGLLVNSRGGRPRSLGESPIGRLVLAVDTACTCCTLFALHDGSMRFLFFIFVSANGLLVGVCQCCCLLMFVCLLLSRHFPFCVCKNLVNKESESESGLFTVCSTGSICVLYPRRVSTLENRFGLVVRR